MPGRALLRTAVSMAMLLWLAAGRTPSTGVVPKSVSGLRSRLFRSCNRNAHIARAAQFITSRRNSGDRRAFLSGGGDFGGDLVGLKTTGRNVNVAADIEPQEPPVEKHKGVRTFLEEGLHTGWTILVGKNAEDNDRLSTKIGNADDFWFHVAGVPGSHVVVRNPYNYADLPRNVKPNITLRDIDIPNEIPMNQVKNVAAGLAAWYSKAKNAGKASVHYTTCRYVKKIPGSPAGQVLLGKYKAISVGPLNPESVTSATATNPTQKKKSKTLK
eukprot:jgi/Bigna1/89526/estExt_fgenesh1_pg.C_510022